MMSMQALVIALAISSTSAIQYNNQMASALKVQGTQATDQVKALRGSVAYVVDASGRDTAATQSAMTSEAKEWLKSMEKSRSRVASLKRDMEAGSRAFQRKQAYRRYRYEQSGFRDLYQEQVDKMQKARDKVHEEDARKRAHAESVAWNNFFHKEVEVPHYHYSKKLAIVNDNHDSKVDVRVQIASDEKEKHVGLMYQEQMPGDAGMLFVYNRPSSQVLYMRNTKIPLEVGWFDKNGNLVEIMDLKPMDETHRWSKSQDVVMGLEMNKDFWSSNQLEPGSAKIDMQEVCDHMIVDGQMNYDLCPSHLDGRNN